MTRLTARAPAEGLTPVDAEGTTLIEVDPGPVTLIAPYDGGEASVDKALKKLKLSLPAPGGSLTAGAARLQWFGLGQWLLVGAEAPDLPRAAVTDQSDGWCHLRLNGPAAEAALARLVPLDLRVASFPEGATARSLIGHMPLSITRIGPQIFYLMVFRSMAASAAHEISAAMRNAAARF